MPVILKEYEICKKLQLSAMQEFLCLAEKFSFMLSSAQGTAINILLHFILCFFGKQYSLVSLHIRRDCEHMHCHACIIDGTERE